VPEFGSDPDIHMTVVEEIRTNMCRLGVEVARQHKYKVILPRHRGYGRILCRRDGVVESKLLESISCFQ
jgi:hypothetical protein